MPPLRIGAVGYLNARPLTWTLDRAPDRWQVRYDVPSVCAGLLARDEVDLALVSSIMFLDADVYRFVPGVAIGSRGPVSSIALFTERPLEDVRTIALDTSSRTAATLVRVLCARRFGITPKAALLSHSNFGTSDHPSAQKMRRTLELLREQASWLEVDGEMHGDLALDAESRRRLMPRSTLAGDANLLVLPNIDAANIAYNLLKTAAGGGIAIGPVLLGAAKPVHILTPSATVRSIASTLPRGGRRLAASRMCCRRMPSIMSSISNRSKR